MLAGLTPGTTTMHSKLLLQVVLIMGRLPGAHPHANLMLMAMAMMTMVVNDYDVGLMIFRGKFGPEGRQWQTLSEMSLKWLECTHKSLLRLRLLLTFDLTLE